MLKSIEGLRVLIFGTDKDSVAWFKKSLIRCGILVSTIESPKRVVTFLRNSRMDLLIVDCHSDNDNASLLIRAIRLAPPRFRHDIPAVVFTNNASDESRAAMLAAGFQAHLQKPVSVDRLVQIVEECAVLGGRILTVNVATPQSPRSHRESSRERESSYQQNDVRHLGSGMKRVSQQ